MTMQQYKAFCKIQILLNGFSTIYISDKNYISWLSTHFNHAVGWVYMILLWVQNTGFYSRIIVLKCEFKICVSHGNQFSFCCCLLFVMGKSCKNVQ